MLESTTYYRNVIVRKIASLYKTRRPNVPGMRPRPRPRRDRTDPQPQRGSDCIFFSCFSLVNDRRWLSMKIKKRVQELPTPPLHHAPTQKLHLKRKKTANKDRESKKAINIIFSPRINTCRKGIVSFFFTRSCAAGLKTAHRKPPRVPNRTREQVPCLKFSVVLLSSTLFRLDKVKNLARRISLSDRL